MSSRVMCLLRKRPFDFGDIAAGGSETVIAHEHVDVACFGDAVLAVRVHSNTTSGTSTIAVAVHSTAPSRDEPNVVFVDSTAAASVTIDAATGAGTLLVAGLLDGFGGALQLRLTGTRFGSDTLQTEISIDLVARVGVAAPRRSLADTLVVGNSSSGTDIVVSSGDGLRPEEDNIGDLGTASSRWRTVYAATSVLINTQPAARIVEAMQISLLRI